MKLKEFKNYIHTFITFLEVEKKASDHTVRAYKNDLKQVLSFWEKIEKKELLITHSCGEMLKRFIIALHYKKISPRTLSRKISCLKAFQQFLYTYDIKISLDIKTPYIKKELPKTLSIDEIFYLLDTIPYNQLPTTWPLRDKAIFEIVYATGIRCSEVTNIEMHHINFNKKTILIKEKKEKERTVLFGNKALESLKNYITKERIKITEKTKSSYLFLGTFGKRLKDRSIQRVFNMFKKLLKTDSTLTPQILRHSFATHLLEKGSDIRFIQELLGHQSIASTEVYTKITSKHLTNMCKEKHPLNNLNHLILNKKQKIHV